MENSKIYGKICDVMGEIGPVTKDRTNKDQGYKFRGIDDVYNALQPAFVKHRVFAVPKVLEHKREDRVSSKGNPLIYTTMKMLYTFFADDGSFVTAETVGEGMDSGDKSTGKAISMAYKYAMFQVLSIPTEEGTPDNENDSHTIAPPPKETVPPPKESVPPPKENVSQKTETVPETTPPVEQEMINKVQLEILTKGYKGAVLAELLKNKGISKLEEMSYTTACGVVKAYEDYLAKKAAKK